MKLYRDLATQEDIDREYNLAAATPGFEATVARYVSESEQARRDLECRLDVPFGPTRDETMDIFPAAGDGAPVVVFIHGGYWRALSSREFSLVARGLVARGLNTVVTNYSLCPKVTIAEITRQSRAAVARIHRYAEDAGMDGSRIVIVGHSAGAQQAAMLMGTDWDGEYGLTADFIRGAVAISGVYDLTPLRYSYLQPALQLTGDMIRDQSPLLNIPARSAPLHIKVGEREPAEFLRQAGDYERAWKKAGLAGSLEICAGLDHFTILEGLTDAGSPLVAGIAAVAGID